MRGVGLTGVGALATVLCEKQMGVGAMAELDLTKIEALTFDVGGTVFDWQSAVRTRAGALATARGADVDVAQFALDWRRRFFELLGEVRSGRREWCSADPLHSR